MEIEAGAALPLRTLAPRHGVTVAALYRHRRNHAPRIPAEGEACGGDAVSGDFTKLYHAAASPAPQSPEPRRLVSWWGADNAARQGDRCCQCGGRVWLMGFHEGGCIRCWVPKFPWKQRFET